MAKPHGKGRKRPQKEKPEFDQTIVDLARVTRVTKGGKQLNFRACVLIGDRKGRVAYGIEKGKDVQIAVDKAVNQAKKQFINVPYDGVSIPHRVQAKFKSAIVMLKPAPQGSGIIAGSSIRSVLEFAGVPNASAKMLGKSSNKITNLKATFKALQSFKKEAVEATMRKKNNIADKGKTNRKEEVRKEQVDSKHVKSEELTEKKKQEKNRG